MIYRIINNRRGMLTLAFAAIVIFSLSEWLFNMSVMSEALLLSFAVLFVMMAAGTSGEISNSQIRESLEGLAYSGTNISAYADDFLKLYKAYQKRVNVLEEIRYIDNRMTSSLIKSIMRETRKFVDLRMKKAYGMLLIFKNKSVNEKDKARLSKIKKAIQNVLTQLDEIAFAINEYGDSKEDYMYMQNYLQDVLESIREYNV